MLIGVAPVFQRPQSALQELLDVSTGVPPAFSQLILRVGLLTGRLGFKDRSEVGDLLFMGCIDLRDTFRQLEHQ